MDFDFRAKRLENEQKKLKRARSKKKAGTKRKRDGRV